MVSKARAYGRDSMQLRPESQPGQHVKTQLSEKYNQTDSHGIMLTTERPGEHSLENRDVCWGGKVRGELVLTECLLCAKAIH